MSHAVPGTYYQKGYLSFLRNQMEPGVLRVDCSPERPPWEGRGQGSEGLRIRTQTDNIHHDRFRCRLWGQIIESNYISWLNTPLSHIGGSSERTDKLCRKQEPLRTFSAHIGVGELADRAPPLFRIIT